LTFPVLPVVGRHFDNAERAAAEALLNTAVPAAAVVVVEAVAAEPQVGGTPDSYCNTTGYTHHKNSCKSDMKPSQSTPDEGLLTAYINLIDSC
jgi:hypothetical protein